MRAIFAMACKDLLLLLRDRGAFLFTLLFPVVFGVFFGVVLTGSNNPSGATLVINDLDNSRWSKVFVSHITTNPTITLKHDSSLNASDDLIASGKAAALVTIPDGFAEQLERALYDMPPELQVTPDPARPAEVAMITGALATASLATFLEALNDPEVQQQALAAAEQAAKGENGSQGNTATLTVVRQMLRQSPPQPPTELADWQPVTFVSKLATTAIVPDNLFAITFAQAIVWAVLGCAASFGATLVTERQQGTLLRLRIAPVSYGQILASKSLACLTMALTASILLLIIARAVFGVPIQDPIKLAASLMAVCVAIVGLMMLLATLGRRRSAVGQFSWGIILAMAIIGGGMLPLAFMPAWMIPLSHFSPVKWAVLAIEAA
ncbi:MAG: ABC transporter permease, partial [Planctomycetota bacterium]